MSESLPGRALPAGGQAAPPPTRQIRNAVLATATRATVRTIPRLNDDLKRLLSGRRSVAIDGNTLDVTMQLWLAAQRAAGIDGLVSSEDVAIARSKLRAAASALDVDIAVAGMTNLSIPGPAGPITARHYRPANAGGAPVLVYYHGGGFVVGDLDTHDSVCRLICRDADIHMLSVEYRLAPEHKAPAAVEDAYAAYRWALDHAGELGADPGRVAVGGDSAGGNLAAVVAQQARNDGVQLPALQLLLYPVTNYSGETRSMTLFADGFFLRKWDMDFSGDKYLSGAVERTDPRVSPLLADDLSGLPPALVLTAGFDPLRDEGNAYAAALRAADTPVDLREYGSLIHGFINFFPLGGGSASASTEMIAALRRHLRQD